VRGLDTNLIVRYLTQDEPEQARKANAAIEEAVRDGKRCFIASIVLCELVWVLQAAYGYDKEDVSRVLEKMLSTVEFSIEDKDLALRALDDYRKGSGDFADPLIGWRNRKSGCETTLTFDRNLKKNDLFTVL
jgi:predicted nucleic-acid-binding protein